MSAHLRWPALIATFTSIALVASHDPTRCAPPAVGIDRDPIPADFAAQALSPFLWRRLVERRTTLARLRLPRAQN